MRQLRVTSAFRDGLLSKSHTSGAKATQAIPHVFPNIKIDVITTIWLAHRDGQVLTPARAAAHDRHAVIAGWGSDAL